MAELVLDLVGDVNLRSHPPSDESCLDDVAAELSSADLRIGNLEGAFSADPAELPYKAGWHHVQPDMAKCLLGRFDVVGCANNVHYGAAIVESARTLDSLGILHTGSGANIDEAHTPAITTVNGIRTGVLAYTSVFEPVGHSATPTAPGVATVKAYTAYEPSSRVLHMPGAPAIVHTWPDAKDLERACADVRSLRDRVDFLIVYMHFGVTSSPVVHEYQSAIAHALIDSGANVIAGAHSHTLGGIEPYNGGLILYSLGNFVFNPGFHPQATRDGAIAKLRVRDGKPEACSLLPTYRNDQSRTEIVDPLRGEGARIAEMISVRCTEMGTSIEVSGGELRVDLPRP